LIIPWAPDLAEAYARAGRAHDAERVTTKLEAQSEQSGTPLAAALAARCRGLVAADPFATLERALELHARADSPFEQARTALILGARLHRARRRAEARERLRAALATFEELGAKPWAARARAELKAAGAVERRPVTDPDELTAQEVRVASAVATGATNREVAASLYLSPKTIEFHLGRVYRKLGIHSRAELATIVAAGGLESGSAATGSAAGGSRTAGGR
jgi:DNA-binding NarL/FixJ family response regulator